jgi:hypothetical protein
MSNHSRPAPPLFLAAPIPLLFRMLAVGLLIAGCAPGVKRDLSKLPAGQVGFDDVCGLQTYFDKLTTKEGTAPTVIMSSEVEGARSGARLAGGRSHFAFETDFQLETIHRVLNENWKRLPEAMTDAKRVDLEVRWSERSGVRRVVTTEDAILMVGRDQFALPYHVCLSELLFGEPLYRRRREVLGLAPLPVSHWPARTTSVDGGTQDAGSSPDTSGSDAPPG